MIAHSDACQHLLLVDAELIFTPSCVTQSFVNSKVNVTTTTGCVKAVTHL
jgi:hypothetical protein